MNQCHLPLVRIPPLRGFADTRHTRRASCPVAVAAAAGLTRGESRRILTVYLTRILNDSAVMKKIRMGLVGAGFAARYHLACLRKVYGVQVELAGVFSIRPDSRRRFGAEHGLAVFDDLEAMIEWRG